MATSEPLVALTDAYSCFVAGSSPGHSPADLAGLICCAVRGLVPGEDKARAPAGSCRDSGVDATCLALTLVDRITCGMTSRSLSPAATVYYAEVLAVLLQDLELMSHLVQQFRTEDQIVSHLAAKTASTCVFYQLLQSDPVSPAWQRACVQALRGSAPGPELDACLWSLTDVSKRLLKGAHGDVLGELLASLDLSLSAFCSRFLPAERAEWSPCVVELSSSSRRWGTTCCLLLDLLEVLTASSWMRGAGVCLHSQRITHTHASALLAAVSCSPQYFVKKRALLLLKRAALQKAGEDWALGGGPATGRRHTHFHSDRSALARSVVTAVAAGWLQSVEVQSASFFGGTRRVLGDEGQGADGVMLRAASLLLLKATELHIHTAGAAGVGGASEAYGCLQRLWGFLRRCSAQLTEDTHRCRWVSLLLADQDDDLVEAANTLFSIFLHHRRCCGLQGPAVLEAACACGCNPHCLFLLLLQSVSFDHSILLDFLISTETCFLEYFVRYLKYLRGDWRGFTAACGRLGRADAGLSGAGDLSKAACEGEPDQVQVGSGVQPPAAGFPLVDYDSSDQSDPEDMEASQEEPGPSAGDTSRWSALDATQEISGPPVHIRQKQDGSPVSHPESTLDRRRGGPSPLQRERTSGRAGPGPPPCDPSSRALRCMAGLREVVARLQAKELFPYNPASLLKLLAQVENCS